MRKEEEKKKKRKGEVKKKNEPLIARLWKNYNGGCLIGNDAAFCQLRNIVLTDLRLRIIALQYTCTGISFTQGCYNQGILVTILLVLVLRCGCRSLP